MKLLLNAGLLHGDCLTVTGKTIAENPKEFPDLSKDQNVIRPLSNPIKSTGTLVVLRGNLAPDGGIAKMSGLKISAFTGPARVFDSEEEATDALLQDQIQDGDVITIDSDKQELSFAVANEELEARRKKWTQPPLRYFRGVLNKYARLVSSADKGAVTDLTE